MNFRLNQKGEAAELVERWHYSRLFPPNSILVGTFHENGGLFGDFGPAIAACVFGRPPARWDEEVWELTRLVRTDQSLPLTSLISLTTKACKKHGADLLVSFANSTKGHHGGIYQAASWNYGGKRKRSMDGVLIEGKFFPGRSCNHKWGTRSPRKLSALLRMEVQPHYDEGKHLYWRALNKFGQHKAKRFHLESLPYPKPDHLGP